MIAVLRLMKIILISLTSLNMKIVKIRTLIITLKNKKFINVLKKEKFCLNQVKSLIKIVIKLLNLILLEILFKIYPKMIALIKNQNHQSISIMKTKIFSKRPNFCYRMDFIESKKRNKKKPS